MTTQALQLRVRVGEGVEPQALLALLQTQFDCQFKKGTRAGILSVARPLMGYAAAVNAGIETFVQPQRRSAVEIAAATLEDVDDMVRIIGYWAREGENLPRSESSIVTHIQDFLIARQGDAVTGCASLMVYNRRLAEIRSLGVLPLSHGKGAGSAIVRACIERASRLQVKTLFVLTRVPDFFARHGFVVTDKAVLPEKISKDCQFCPKQHACDETAMVLPLA